MAVVILLLQEPIIGSCLLLFLVGPPTLLLLWVSVKSRRVGMRPTKLLVTREKKPLVPRLPCNSFYKSSQFFFQELRYV